VRHRPVRVRTGSRDSGALSVPMQTVDSTASRDAAVHADRQRKHVALPGRQGSDRRCEMGARHGRSASEDPIRDGDRKT
jgi:hypothetical protein